MSERHSASVPWQVTHSLSRLAAAVRFLATQQGGSHAISFWEVAIAGSVAAALLILRWFYAPNYSWNSDEPQHLHVVWAWVNGYLPYRDIFDNHSPLFQMLCAPVFALFGERADIVTPMRLAMVPLFGVSLWLVYCLGASVFSRRTGLWAAVFCALLPQYFFKMGEFRTDVLWTTAWLGILVILTGGPLTRRRLFYAGLGLGAAFSISMKSVLMLITILSAAGVTYLAWRRFGPDPVHAPRQRLASGALAVLAGAMLIPGVLLWVFASQGALKPLYYCVIEHNTMPGANSPTRLLLRLVSWEMLAFIPALAVGGSALPLFATAPHRAARRLFVLLIAGFYYPLLHGLWPIITLQDNVPWYPLLTVALTPGLLLLTDRMRYSMPAFVLPLFLAMMELAWLLKGHPPFKCYNKGRIETIDQTLRLTEPGEYVMDAKGESIYRPRPYYYVLETLTQNRLRAGLLSDNLPERLIATHTAVLHESSRLTKASTEFVAQNYIRVGHIDVLGKTLPSAKRGAISFEVIIPQRYAFTSPHGPVQGILDGKPIEGSRQLEAGRHDLILIAPDDRTTLIWARALEKGFSPFRNPSPRKP